jgi:hypothetical protein
VFLPNPEPPGPVDHVFVCMEPSLGRWARSAEEARTRIDAGFRNFLCSIEDFVFHFCVREYLRGPGQEYHLTDLSKGAMLVERAGVARTERYDRWYGLLEEELALVARPGATVFAVGRIVAENLEQRSFPRPVTTLLHYSGQAGRARNAGIAGYEREFEAFGRRVELERVLETAGTVMKEAGMPEALRAETLARLKGGELTESRKKLMFSYKRAFGATRSA